MRRALRKALILENLLVTLIYVLFSQMGELIQIRQMKFRDGLQDMEEKNKENSNDKNQLDIISEKP